MELAKRLGNVSQTCKVFGYSRDSFNRFRELYETGGALSLQETIRKKACVKNRVAQEIEYAVCAMAIKKSAHGQLRVSNELKKEGLFIYRREFDVSGSGMTLKHLRRGSRRSKLRRRRKI